MTTRLARAKGTRAKTAGNVVPLRPKPRRRDLEGAIVRVIVPTAADLTPRQRAIAAEAGAQVNLDRYAQRLAASEQARWYPRRGNESDATLTQRRRHHVALAFARWLVLELEALRPTAETAPIAEPDPYLDPDAWKLAGVLEAVEIAQKRWSTDGRADDARRRIGAVRDALEHARRWTARHRAEPPIEVDGGRRGVFEVDVDVIVEQAIGTCPELGCIPISEWRAAIAAWPGIVPRPGGGARRKAPKQPGRDGWTWNVVAQRARILGHDWAAVVFTLLAPHGLTNAKDPTNLAKTWEPSKGAKDTSRIR